MANSFSNRIPFRLKILFWRFLDFSALIRKWIGKCITRLRDIIAIFSFIPVLFTRSRSRVAETVEPLEIVMLVVSNLRFDPRVEREARVLARSGYRVKIIVPDISKPKLAESQLDWGAGVEFVLIPPEASHYANKFPYIFGKMLLDRAIMERPFAFHCHDLTTTIIGLTAARRVGSYCVCDFHEWWSENVKYDTKTERFIPHAKNEKRILRFVEQLVLKKADKVITVCDSIADEFDRLAKYKPKTVKVVRNIPVFELSPREKKYPCLKCKFNIREDQQLLIYQGGVGPSRHLGVIIEALTYAPNTVLALRGPAIELYEDGYRKQAIEFGVQDRLFCMYPVPSADVVAAAAASGADAGLYTVSPICLNWKLALPNKIFEYMAAGLPIIAANYPEVKKIIDQYEIGMVFDPDDPRSIANVFNQLVSEPILLTRFRSYLNYALSDMRADNEWQKVIDLYEELESNDRRTLEWN